MTYFSICLYLYKFVHERKINLKQKKLYLFKILNKYKLFNVSNKYFIQ